MATATLPTATDPVRASTSEPSPPRFPQDDVLYEVVDGKIVELPPMGILETEIGFALATALDRAVKAHRSGKVVSELLFRIDVVRNLKRRPDLAFVSKARWPYGKRVPSAEAWDMVPDLAVEVVSDSNGANEVIVKVNEYFQAGSRLVWVVYTVVRQVYVYSSATDVHILAEQDELDGGEVIAGFCLPLRTLFEDEPDADPATTAVVENGSPEA
jgi:Uma2 family endonuclease